MDCLYNVSALMWTSLDGTANPFFSASRATRWFPASRRRLKRLTNSLKDLTKILRKSLKKSPKKSLKKSLKGLTNSSITTTRLPRLRRPTKRTGRAMRG